MIKIITAIGNPKLNSELRKYQEFEVVGNDIVYYEGITELLEINNDINYLIIGELSDEINYETFFNKIIQINKKIKIIAIVSKKNKNIETNLLTSGICEIFYDDTNISEIINNLKTKNIEYLNVELRAEINSLKKLILEKNSKNTTSINWDKEQNKIIGICGNPGIGKTSFSIMMARAIKKYKKILIVDFSLTNSPIKKIFGKEIEYSKINEKNINNFILNIEENFDILTGLDLMYKYGKLEPEYLKNNINKIKNNYDYILFDINTSNNFEINNLIFNLVDTLIVLNKLNKMEFYKTKILLENIIKKANINNEKINILNYNNKIIDILKLKKYRIKNFNNIGFFISNYFYDFQIKNCFKYNIFNKIKCKKIIKN